MDEPILYSDGVQVGISPFTVTLAFTVAPPAQPGTQAPIPVATIRMSPEHAKVVAIILRKQLKQFEQQLGQDIGLPHQVFQQLGLSPTEDW
ncbi:MAG TPA: DUF3467 domain-containing protein [Candidatus Methylomirabilis sp.]|nr:DUF3467 domain-containing protein [Candidatus Methylomirabilis sp.]